MVASLQWANPAGWCDDCLLPHRIKPPGYPERVQWPSGKRIMKSVTVESVTGGGNRDKFRVTCRVPISPVARHGRTAQAAVAKLYHQVRDNQKQNRTWAVTLPLMTVSARCWQGEKSRASADSKDLSMTPWWVLRVHRENWMRWRPRRKQPAKHYIINGNNVRYLAKNCGTGLQE